MNNYHMIFGNIVKCINISSNLGEREREREREREMNPDKKNHLPQNSPQFSSISRPGNDDS